jgi:hypothetical protein
MTPVARWVEVHRLAVAGKPHSGRRGVSTQSSHW